MSKMPFNVYYFFFNDLICLYVMLYVPVIVIGR